MRNAIDEALKQSLKAQNKRRVSTLRLINAAIQDRDIAARGTGRSNVSDDDVMQILAKMIKQREESARMYEEGGRLELAEQEREESEIIREFLPKQVSEDEMKSICKGVVTETGAHGLRDVGRCMSTLKERYPGKMDFAKASGVVKTLLTEG
ncbi:GatB/YqeY domain-containing protein [Methylobrevis pamukkalensis]|uniref:Yqey-like protein n=1 Tax=Methylobrevis pamukkalensis TaxID=1439726 RepID=A0A1E3GZE6_9HYPH|nr:GatB/YqeY domain-containing protein [Methylobrevis pamukkalensis]ODN69423.1 Yqey-like protein [Methylobrevis pamukkalensis]